MASGAVPNSVSDRLTIGDEETTDPHEAWRCNYFMVEVWSKDGKHIEQMLHAGNRLDKAREVFEAFTKKRPRTYVTLKQRAYVMAKSAFACEVDS